MRLTSEHAEFYRQHRAPMPKWASEFLPRSRVSIHTCIAHHANAPKDTDSMHDIGNLLAIVRMIQKRVYRATPAGDLRAAIMRDELARISREAHNKGKREAIARKWAKRIERDMSRFVRDNQGNLV